MLLSIGISEIELSSFLSGLVFVLFHLNFSFLFSPVLLLKFSKKGYKDDEKYLNLLIASFIIRLVIWIFAYFSLCNLMYILALNALGMLAYALISNKLKQIQKIFI